MNLIILKEGITGSIIPILTLIEHKPESIVRCILLGQDSSGVVPSWFVDSTLAENPAGEILKYINNGSILEELDIFLVVKEPGSLLQMNVLAAVGCCNLNFSGEGGRGGKTVIEFLAKRIIRTYPAEVERPAKSFEKSSTEWQQEVREAFEDSFNVVASRWLPESWNLEAAWY